MREHFFGRDPRTKALVEHMTDSEIWNLKRGGHDYRKVYAAYRAAVDHKGQPTVILAKTIKGYSLGAHFQGRNATHQMKSLRWKTLSGSGTRCGSPSAMRSWTRIPTCRPTTTPGRTPRRSATCSTVAAPSAASCRAPHQGQGAQAALA